MPAAPKQTPAERLLAGAVSVFTILAIVGGLYGYFGSQRDKRVEKTFEFYKALHSEPLRTDRALLVSRWNQSAEKAKPLIDGEKYNELAVLVTSLVSDKDGSDSFGRVLDFFDELNSCVQHSLCDQNAVVALLRPSADELIESYGAHIRTLRIQFGDQQFGSSVYKVRSLKVESTLTAIFLH